MSCWKLAYPFPAVEPANRNKFSLDFWWTSTTYESSEFAFCKASAISSLLKLTSGPPPSIFHNCTTSVWVMQLRQLFLCHLTFATDDSVLRLCFKASSSLVWLMSNKFIRPSTEPVAIRSAFSGWKAIWNYGPRFFYLSSRRIRTLKIGYYLSQVISMGFPVTS